MRYCQDSARKKLGTLIGTVTVCAGADSERARTPREAWTQNEVGFTGKCAKGKVGRFWKKKTPDN